MRILHTSCTFQILYCRWMQLSHKNIKSFHPRSIMCTFHPNILVTLYNAHSLCLLYLVVIFLWFWSPANDHSHFEKFFILFHFVSSCDQNLDGKAIWHKRNGNILRYIIINSNHNRHSFNHTCSTLLNFLLVFLKISQ